MPDRLQPDTPHTTADLAERLERPAAELRSLGEAVEALPHEEGSAISLRRAKSVFLVVLVLAALGAWWRIGQWQAILATFAPLLWIIHGSRRWGTRRPPADL